MSRAVVIYDSNFGNNEKLAKALSKGLKDSGVTVQIFKVGEFNPVILQNFDLICLGGPTHIARISNSMKDFLAKLKPVDLQGKEGFCFGTRMNSRMNVFNINGSAKKIENKLKKKGVHMVKDAVNVLVEGREGPLTEGSEGRFTDLGYELGGNMQQ